MRGKLILPVRVALTTSFRVTFFSPSGLGLEDGVVLGVTAFASSVALFESDARDALYFCSEKRVSLCT